MPDIGYTVAFLLVAAPFGLLVAAIFSTGVYYTLARAEITRGLWSNYGPDLDRVAKCPACSGTWIGAGLFGAPLGSWLWSFTPAWWDAGKALLAWFALTLVSCMVLGLCMQVLVPIVLRPMLRAIRETTVKDDDLDRHTTLPLSGNPLPLDMTALLPQALAMLRMAPAQSIRPPTASVSPEPAKEPTDD